MRLLLEGRLDTVYNKYKQKIDKERKLNSSVSETSWYDKLAENNHFQDTNFKYLDDVLILIYKQYLITDYEDYEPLSYDDADNYIRHMNGVVERLGEAISYYDFNKDRFTVREIKNYSNIDDFLQDVNEKQNTLSKKEEKKIQKSGAVQIFSNDEVSVVKPITYEASCYYGAGTKWCTASKNTDMHWSNKGNLYYVFLKRYKDDNRFYKVAIQTFFDSDFDQSIYWDATDESMTKKEEQLFKMVLPEDAKQAIKSDFTKSRPNTLTPIIQSLESDVTTAMEVLEYVEYDLGDSNDTLFIKIPPFQIENSGGDDYLNAVNANTRIYLTSKKFGDLQYEDVFLIVTQPQIGAKSANADVVFDVGEQGLVPQSEGVDLFEGLVNSSQYAYPISNFSSQVKERIIKNLISRYISNYDSNLKKWMNKTYPDTKQAYTMAGYTFTKGGNLTKKFLKYMKDIGEDTPVSRKKVLTDLGIIKQTKDGWVNAQGNEISLSGYLSSFFSALKQADIIKGTGKNFTIGPKFEKFAKKYNI
jgi:hypothetical protein